MAQRVQKRPQAVQPAAPVAAKPVPFEIPDDNEAGDDIAQQAIAAIRATANEDTGGDWDCDVYRVMGANRDGVKMPWLFAVDVSELRHLRFKLADLYPEGGRYRIRVRRDGVMFKQFDLEIEKRIASMMPAPAPIARQGETFEPVVQMIDKMMERQERFMDAIVSRLAAPAAPAVPPQSLSEQIDIFVKLQGLLPREQQNNALDMFQKGMDFATKLVESAGGRGSETNIMDVVKGALESPVVKGLFETMAAGAMNNQHPQPVAPAIAPQPWRGTVAPAAAPAPEPPPAAQQAMNWLFSQAAAGAQPELVAEQALRMLPAGVMDELEAQDDIVAYLEGMFPQVTQHRPWFEALVANMFEGDDDGAAPQQGGTFANPRPSGAVAPLDRDPPGGGGNARDS